MKRAMLLVVALGITTPPLSDCFTTVVVTTPFSSSAAPPPPPRVTNNFQRTVLLLQPPITAPSSSTTTTALYAKKKKGKNTPKDAALAALEAIEAQEHTTNGATTSAAVATATLPFDEAIANEPLTKKEQMTLEKQRQKEAKKVQREQERLASLEQDTIEKNTRKKALRALAEMEAAERDAGTVNNSNDDDTDEEDSSSTSNGDDGGGGGGKQPPMSKKELKMAAKKAEKEAEKQLKKDMKRKAKKLGITVEELEQQQQQQGGDVDEFGIPPTAAAPTTAAAVNGDDATATTATTEEQQPPSKKIKLTAEERIRKERPPPRIRVMESSQPDYTALRFENIAITFRDQPVLTSATWGVQTGDRIGLVGANGAGKTTQLRILAGELEPTAGDVLKSSKDLRVAMLRQEFIDELDLTRTLRAEFRSVFTEEASIMTALREAEEELAQMSGSVDDANAMQDVLDRMSKLQNKADAKNVNALDSRVSKIMDLMGFELEEGEYEVSAFSGGWKMRIGLGKVLLQDPNILLLDEPTNHLVRFFRFFYMCVYITHHTFLVVVRLCYYFCH